MAPLTNGGAALKMGFSLASRKAPTAAPKPKLKRPHSLLEEDEKREEAQEATSTITTFGNAGADAKKPVERVIPRIPNAERWSHVGARKRTKIESTSSNTADTNGDGETSNEVQQFGLVVPTKPAIDDAAQAPPSPVQDTRSTSSTKEEQPRTADDEALAALTGTSSHSKTIRPTSPPLSDQAAFERDFRTAPPQPTLEQYNATPVDGFGAALLRGMLSSSTSLEQLQKQWEDKAPKSLLKKERNENAMKGYRLGLGAKASGLGIEKVDLRTGKKGKEGDEMDVATAPLKRRNKITGEEMTEEEFRERLRLQKEEDKINRMEIDEGGGGSKSRRKQIEDGGSSRRDKYRDEEDDEAYYERKKREKEERRRRRDDDDDRHKSRRQGRDEDDTERRRRRDREQHDDSDRMQRRDKDKGKDSHHSSRRHSRTRERSRDRDKMRR